MKKSYVRLLKENRMLVMSFITLAGLLLVDRLGYASVSQHKEVFFADLFTLVVLFLAWLLDVLTINRRHHLNAKELKDSMCNDLQAAEVPFVLRIASAPHPAAEFEARFASIIEVASYWDWTFYRKSGSKSLNDRILAEVERFYLQRPVSTSTFGIIKSAWTHTTDIVIIGIVHSDEHPLAFVRNPWELPERGQVKLKPSKVYAYSYVPGGDEDDPHLTHCEMYDSPPAVERLLRQVLNELSNAQRELWSVADAREWRTKIEPNKHDITTKLSDVLTAPGRISLSRSTPTFLRTWLPRENAFALILGFVGYLLSPFSFYNDAIVNIPLALFAAEVSARILPVNRSILLAFYYLLTNAVGIALLILAFRRVDRRIHVRYLPTSRQWALLGTYALVIILLHVIYTDVTSAFALGRLPGPG